ncbi:SymE family type I addiction module toxin, partial [Pectobacterium parmentieri]|uniref:SymE family type I addiction module toxin n=1 Tax=Pectobacterium parmentieri TaxID=1905730 RepID=UPI001E31521E
PSYGCACPAHHSHSGPQTRPVALPSAINLKGRWLEESRFITRMPIAVTVERGRLVIETEINL